MNVARLTLIWSFAFVAIALTASSLTPFGVSAETRIRDSMIYPAYEFYRGGAFASVTSSTIEQVLFDRLSGLSAHVSDRSDYTKRLAAHFYRLCSENRLDPAFVLSVIEVESNFRVNAVSAAGAVGLMQLMPATAQNIAHRHAPLRQALNQVDLDLRDPFLNLTLGITYLRDLKERYSGLSPYLHLAAYNMGPHRLDVLRARPGFTPDKSLKYFQDIMRGVENWRHYGFQSFSLGLKEKPDAARKTITRNVDPV